MTGISPQEPPQPHEPGSAPEQPGGGPAQPGGGEQPGGGGPQQAGQDGRQSGIVIARPFGVPVTISPYWFLFAAVIVFFWAGTLPAWVRPESVRIAVSVAFVVLLYASVLVHELSHCATARGFGLKVRRVLLYPLGGFSEIEQEPQTPAREFLVSASGPATSLALAAIGFGLNAALNPAGIVRELLDQLIVANLLVGVFNLLPGLPLDGGRMLRAGIWKLTGRPGASTIAAAWAGRGLAVLIVAAALFGLREGFSLAGSFLLWLLLIAVFIWISAGQAMRAAQVREKLPQLQARGLARRAIPIEGNIPLSEAIRRADDAHARALVIVDREETPVAIVSETAVTATPAQRRPWVEVRALARALEPGMVLSADLSGQELIEAVQRSPASEYLLIEPSGQVFGVLATTDLDRAFAAA